MNGVVSVIQREAPLAWGAETRGYPAQRQSRGILALFSLGVVAGLCACEAPADKRRSAPTPSPEIVLSDPCGQTHQEFMTAAAGFTQNLPATKQKSNPKEDAASLVADAQVADDALAGLVGTFGTLAACRSDVLAPAEIKAAHGALDIASASQKILAARLASQRNGPLPPHSDKSGVAVASIAMERPYLATDLGRIYDHPNIKARPIATLRKGQRLTSSTSLAEAERNPGWVQIDLNDGSSGYVLKDIVRPLEEHISTRIVDKTHETVAVIDIITEALPEKLAALDARLALSEASASGGP